MNFKLIGATLILMGTAIGAGMLALPIVSADAGFWQAFGLLVVVWALMLTTGLLVLEVCLAFPVGQNNFDSMAFHTLGPIGRIVAWVTVLLLLYALTAAYISGDASLLFELFTKTFTWHIPQWVDAVLFTLIFGGIVFWSTRAVDLLNRGLMSLKGLALIVALVLLLPHIQFANLIRRGGVSGSLWAMAPIFLTSFGFHTVIPSLANYLGKEVRALKRVVIWGASVPLVIYILWLLAALGIVPLTGSHSFAVIQTQHRAAGVLIANIVALVHSHASQVAVNVFSNVAMTTSFLGVSLGLFDFIRDALKRQNHRGARIQVAALTFVPPLVFALWFPEGFILALGYAGICVAILEVIMPALMAFQLRRSLLRRSVYTTPGGLPLLIVVFVLGCLLVVTQI